MAWIFQKKRDVKQLGSKAPWFVAWRDTEGNKRSKKCGYKTAAKKYKSTIEADLIKGRYRGVEKKQWGDFRREFEERVLCTKRPATAVAYRTAFDHFERICRPKLVANITGRSIDQFIAQRLKDPGAKPRSTVSRATVNKDLRALKMTLNKAVDWKYLVEAPKIKMQKELEGLYTHVTIEHFKAIYDACDVATKPPDLPCDSAEWWRAFIVFLYMTGWRVSELLSLVKADLDLAAKVAITRAKDNKGGRDELVPLHEMVVEHLLRIKSLRQEVFPWDHGRSQLWNQFHTIQIEAGIKLPCKITQEHEHTPRCFVYGFHDLRRAFATDVAADLTGDKLQKMMRHKSFATTQVYINARDRLKGVTETLNAPEVKRRAR